MILRKSRGKLSSLCVFTVHTLCTHLCKLVWVCSAPIHAYGSICFLNACVFVCLHSSLPVCLCEFCKLFTALAVSVHCWWQWKVCLIVVVPQWKFNSAPFHWKKPPAEPSHHTHVPLGFSFGGVGNSSNTAFINTFLLLEEEWVIRLGFDKRDGEQVNYCPQPTPHDPWPSSF